MRPNLALAALLCLFLLAGGTYSLVTPIFEAPDEIQHFAYVAHLAEGRGFPPQGDPTTLSAQEASQPPLYYALAALLILPVDVSDLSSLVWINDQASIGNPLQPGNKNRIIHTDREAWPYRDSVLAVHLVRWLSVLLGAGTVFFVYQIGRALFPAAPDVALAAAAFTALTPQFVFISSAVTNDNMITFMATATLWWLVHGVRGVRPRGWSFGLGLLLGLTALAKLSGLALWALTGGLLLLVGARRGSWRRTVVDLISVFTIALAVAGWWYARNWRLYGDPTALNVMLAVVGRHSEPLTWRALLDQFEGLRISYWALFGWFNLLLPNWVYRVLDVLSGVAALGLVLQWQRLRQALRLNSQQLQPADRRWLMLPAIWIVLMLAGLIRWTLITPGTQGRLLYPAAWAISLLWMLGWFGWADLLFRAHVGTALRWGWRVAPLALLAVWTWATPFTVIRPAYAFPAILAVRDVPADVSHIDVTHGGIARVIGYELPQETVRPGQRLPVTVYWEVLAPTDRDPTAYVHLLGRGRQVVGQIDTYLGLGAYPFALLKPGDVVKDTYHVSVAPTADAPTLLRIEVGLFDRHDPLGPGFPATGTAGQPADRIIAAARLLPIRAPTYAVEQPASFDLGGQVKLSGYALSATTARPGETVTLTLYWLPLARLAEDFQVFVHLAGADRVAVAQGDKTPLDGDWPSSAWEPGLAFRDEYPIALPADMPPGAYDVRVGLYRLADGWRLPVTGTTGPIPDAAMTLGQMTVH